MPDPRAVAPGPSDPPTTDDVRRVVRRIVDETLGAPGSTTAQPAAVPAAAPATTPPLAAPATTSPPAAPPATPPPPPAPTPTGTPGATPAGRERVAIAIGADHGGFALKERIGRALAEAGYEVRDCGTHGPEAVDYPDFAHVVARLVADGTCRWGIVVDGAGIGSCMVANKVPGVRAALCHDVSSARNSREHNHANVLTLGARFLGEGLALEIVQAWLATDWGPGRHAGRVDKITEIERRYMKPPGEGRAG